MRVLAALVLSLWATAAWADPDNYNQIERGRGLAIAGDCIACHTAPNSQPYAGGRGIETPFGTITSANLTPDLETGLGTWSEEDFAQAMHLGVRPDGTHLYPAFPYPFYTKVSRADSDAIYAFLRTLPATRYKVNRSTLPFPFDIRASMIGWNALFFTPGAWVADPAKTVEFNRGAYLVEGLGHCGACHTPMNALGGSKAAAALQGNVIQAWVAPNITPDNYTGLGTWSVADVVEYLKTGRNARSAASGPMTEVVQYSTALMPDADLRAIAVYLKERVAAGPVRPAPLAGSDPAMQAGAAIYRDTCSACHTEQGLGVERLFPRLAGSAAVQQPDPTTLARIVISGARGAATRDAPTAPAMPALGWRLDDAQVAAVLTYVRNAWGNAAPAVGAAEVGKVRSRVTGR